MTDRVYTYFSELGFRFDILKKHSHESDLFLSKRFNVFDYIYVDENRLSDIIADLLNPNGKHGQSDLFLNEFIKIINRKDLIQGSFPKVIREMGTTFISRTQRRMDILIDWTTNGIMIENKPWADDQYEQILDYKRNLEKRYKDKFIIVYLSKNYQNPSEVSILQNDLNILIQNNQFIQISFEIELLLWIKNCIKESQSDKMRHFLKDFSTYLNDNFN
jgi:hypothetical protein